MSVRSPDERARLHERIDGIDRDIHARISERARPAVAIG
jgi:hypothetical protein